MRQPDVFALTEEDLVKYRYTYGDRETYPSLMSNRYILGLYTLCLAAWKGLADGEAAETAEWTDKTDKERSMVKLENIRDVLFQCFLLDSVKLIDGRICADLCTVYYLVDKPVYCEAFYYRSNKAAVCGIINF